MDEYLKRLDQLIGLMAEDNKKKAISASSVNEATLLTQPGGIFAVTGLDNAVITLHIRPMGIGSLLPAFASNIDDPRYGLIVGVSDTIGSEPVNICDPAPTGYIKGGTLTAAFGHVTRRTNPIEPHALLMEQRGVNTNLQLIGEMLNGGPMSPDVTRRNSLNLVIQSEMYQVGVQLDRTLAVMTWQGTPSVNTAGGGYKEFPGLDVQIATGQKDAETGTTIPAADSIIFNFNGNSVDGNTLDIVEYMAEAAYHLEDVARRTGVDPVTWVIAMRPELWQELTEIWPCRYLTNRCSTFVSQATNPVVINDDNNVRMRNEMRKTMTLDLNGKQYRVVTDQGIFEKNNANTAGIPAGFYQSDIYFVPLRIAGNFPATYWEYLNYANLNRELAALGMGRDKLPFWTDGGRFLWSLDFYRTCFDLQATVHPRIVLRTPHLAAKIEDVRYSPMRHLRDFNPDSPYWVDGGVSLRGVPTVGQAVWR